MTTSEKKYDVSVVIPTHNRCDLLLRTLKSLEKQSLPADRYEVIVVFDNCEDASFEETHAQAWLFAFTGTEVAFRNAAATRNAGAKLARGERLVFLDDDIEVEEDFLRAHLFATDGDYDGIVLGPVVPDVVGDGWFKENLSGWWAQRLEAQSHPAHRFEYSDLASGNFSIRRVDFARLGGFDSSLAVREDYEFGWRCLDVGVKMVFSPGAIGHHRDDSDLRRNMRRVYAEGAADVAFARLHPASFPALRVAGLAARTRSSRWLRFTGFDAPWAPPILIAFLIFLLPLLERLRLRSVWNGVANMAWGFSYHHAAAQALGSRAALRDIAWHVPEPDYATLTVDLTHGVEQAREKIRRKKPGELVIHSGSMEVGRLTGWPGSEPIAAHHFDNWLEHNLYSWINPVSVARRLPPLPPSPPKPESAGLSIGELDLNDWSLTPIRQRLSLPLILLVRKGKEILGSIALGEDDVAKNSLLEAARRAVLADQDICEKLVREIVVGPDIGPATPPPISVVVCTRDRTENLEECLHALRRLQYPHYEIVVVDNAPTTDATFKLVSSLPDVRYVREDRPGLDWARNAGVNAAHHDIVAYTDDDTRADAFWLQGLAKAFGDPTVSAVTGLVSPMELDDGPVDYFEFIYGGDGQRIPSSDLVAQGHWPKGDPVGASLWRWGEHGFSTPCFDCA